LQFGQGTRDLGEHVQPAQRYSNRGLLRERFHDPLSNPPDRVGDELEPTLLIESFCRSHESHVSGTDQLRQRQTPPLILLGDGDDEAQVRLNETIPRFLVTPTNAACKISFLWR
jgi:hypothetical protein